MTPAVKKHRMSIKDYTVTLDTQRSRDDMLVLRLDPLDGRVPALVLPFGAQQLTWAIQDPEYFEGGYKTWLATNVISVLDEQGWSLEQVATALDVPITTAMEIHAKAVADAAEKAAHDTELAEVTEADLADLTDRLNASVSVPGVQFVVLGPDADVEILRKEDG